MGDEEFKEKCIQKIREMKNRGSTFLFVSHNMNAIEENCNRTILLNNGEILLDDFTELCIKTYYQIIYNKENRWRK